MLKYALFEYIPQRMLRRASFEEQEASRKILLFKSGHRSAVAWAVRAFLSALSQTDLTDTIIIPIPASCQHTYTRRYKRFMAMLCKATGAVNGLSFIKVDGHRDKAHIAGGEVSHSLENISIDTEHIKGRKVVIIDDIYTTGRTADRFLKMMVDSGAEVRMMLFLAKTRQRRMFNPYK